MSNPSEIRRIETIVQHMPGNIYFKDLQGIYRACSDYMIFESGLGTPQTLLGKTDYDLFSKEEADLLKENDEYVFKSGKYLSAVESITLPIVGKHYFTIVKVPVYDSKNNIIGLLGNSLDITRQKELEADLREAKQKAEIANELKTDFIRNMQHDIRTPLSGLWGMADILEQTESDEQKKENLQDLKYCANELLEYCNSVVEFSNLESNPLPLLDRPFNLHDLMGKVKALELPAAQHKGLQLVFHCEQAIPSTLVGDDRRIYRLLINLVSNAIKFTPEGSVQVVAQLAVPQEQRNIILKLTVQDTGIGIPEDKQQFIYEKFYRLTPSNKGTYKGLGLGLRVVKQFIEDLNGDIFATSAPHKGSTFVCAIPLKLPLMNDISK